MLESPDVSEVCKLVTCVCGLALLMQLACLNDCQRLCNSWYEFREVVCEETDVSADLNRCLSDYHTLPVGGSDAQLCQHYLVFVEALDAEDQLYCGELMSSDGAYGLVP